MIRILVRLPALLGLWLTLCVAGSAQELAKPLAAVELKDGDSIVFLGDSITHQRLYTQYVEDYFYTRFPKQRLVLHNAGVGGARAWDALARFDKDVAAYKPKYVTILLGMNDGSYTPYKQEIFDTYRQDMTTLLDRIKEIGATPIPMTPTMFDARAARMRDAKRDTEATTLYNSVLTYFGTWLREVSAEKGYGFVDMWGPLNTITLNERERDPKFTLIADAVHPDAPGQVVMATALVNDIGLPHQVSRIVITQEKSTGNGGTLSDFKLATEGNQAQLEFTWQADSLPWVLPEEAALGAQLTHLGHRLSREALEVHGLPTGTYALSIDGQEVGQYGTAALERGVELETNAKTPQYAQALEVAMLNKQRNDGPIGALRGEWSKFQQYARLKQAAEAQPDNADLKMQLAKSEEAINGMDDRVAKANADARAIEDQIFTKNQPPARKYVLQRIK
ncbi:MAG: SGNH/GDSL hydrolase family protein [Planctomycetaceae bacterium]